MIPRHERDERVRQLLTRLAARGPDLAPMTPEQAMQHDGWWLVLYRLLGRQSDQIALRELTAVDFIRTLLLREGKYLAGDKGGYKILLPSENRAQVDAYMSQADRKLRRAQTLLRNTPARTHKQVDQTEARIMMKRESIRERGRDARQPAAPLPSPRSIKPERDLRPPAAH